MYGAADGKSGAAPSHGRSTMSHDKQIIERDALAAHGVEVYHVKMWQPVGKLRRRHGLVMTGEPREPGYRVEDWLWEAKRVRSTVRGG